ncbi:MAG: acyltransferase domain-containing protein, partial [Chlamydiales bacterium]|nr:acyltransferase domain-containing protein [Chlamydiales bacterium]
GMVKVLKILQDKVIPPNLNYSKANPLLEFDNHPLKVNTQLFSLEQGKDPLRACINSLGIGGTNAHAICEEAPQKTTQAVSRSHYLLCLSAKTDSANQKQTENLSAFIKENPSIDLFNVATTLTNGRTHFSHRAFLVVDSTLSNLESQSFIKSQVAKNHEIAFIFPGLGLDFHPLAKDLYESEQVFKECVDRCAVVIKEAISIDIVLYFTDKEAFEKAAVDLSTFEVDQLITFVFSYSYASLFIHWGIQPAAMLGYSFGEIVAAVLADVMNVKDALLFIIKRGELISKTEAGGMLSVPLSKLDVLPLIQDKELSVAIDNGQSCILAGTEKEMSAFEDLAKHKKLLCMRVKAQYGIHSHLMQPIRDEFAKIFTTISLQKPKIPVVSCVSGSWADQKVADVQYWIEHLSHTMCFVEGIHTLAKKEYLYVVIGPQHEYSSLLKRFLPKNQHDKIITCGQANQYSAEPLKLFYQQVGALWASGAQVHWNAFYAGAEGQRIPLPTYPFDRLKVAHKKSVLELMQEFINGYSQTIVSKSAHHEEEIAPVSATEDFPEVAREMMSTSFVAACSQDEHTLVAIWEDFLGVQKIGLHDHFLELGGNSLKAITILAKIQSQFGVTIALNEFFNDPTIAFLASRISNPVDSKSSPLEVAKERSSLLLTPAQQLLLRLQKMLGYEFVNEQKIVLSGIDEARMQKAIDECIQNNAIFGLKVDGVFVEEQARQSTIKLSKDGDTYIFSIRLSALVSDGFTINLLIKQIVESYVHGHIQKPKVDFLDYLASSRAPSDGQAKNYWNQHLPLITHNFAKEDSLSFIPKTITVDIPEEDAKELYRFAKSCKITANTLFTTILSLSVKSFACAIGLVLDDRIHPDTLQMPGMFRKVLPLALSVDPLEEFNISLSKMNEQLIEAMTYKNYDYELDLIHAQNDFPLFHPVIQFHETMTEKNVSDIELHEVVLNHYCLPFVLKCDVFRLQEGVQFCFSYNSNLLSLEDVESVVTNCKRIIQESILVQPAWEV